MARVARRERDRARAAAGELAQAFAEAPIVDQLEEIELDFVRDADAIARALETRKPRALRRFERGR